MACRIMNGAILIQKNKPGYIDLGDDVLVIPRISCINWEEFIEKVNELYIKHTALNQDNKIGLEIITLK